MGISCSSRESRSVATIKVILLNGKLQEFLNPVKVSEVLHKNPKCFICNADEMDFNEFVTAINEEEEELQQGHLYFVLPLGWLNRRLQAEDMAALAVKASVGLSRRGSGNRGRNIVTGWCCIRGRVCDRLIFCEDDDRKSREVVAAAGGGCGGLVRNNGGKGLKFATNLSVIIEE